MATTPKSTQGLFTSQASIAGVESNTNTLTYTQLITGLSIYDHVGWVLSRLEFRVAVATWALFNGSGDSLSIALTQSNNAAALSENDPAIVYLDKLVRIDWGTAANATIQDSTIVHDFSNLAGGGLLVLPTPLYLAQLGGGLSGASTVTARLFFQAIDLSDTDYFNLVQARQLLLA